MKKKVLSTLLVICMLLSLLPMTALAEGETTSEASNYVASITAGETTTSYTTLAEAIAAAQPGGTITLLQSITGDPININAYDKTFSIDKTDSSFTYPALIGSYTASTNYFSVVGYGAAGVTATHAKATALKVDTYTNTPITESTIAAYVARTDAGATSTAYVCTDMTTALAKCSGPYYTAVHLKADFTTQATTTTSTAFTLYTDGHAMTGTITKTGYRTDMTDNNDGSYSVKFSYVSLTVSNGTDTFQYTGSEFAQAVEKANTLTGMVTMTQVGSVSVTAPMELNANVTYVISTGKKLTLSASFTVKGTLTNNGTINIGKDGALTAKTDTAGTLTAPNANYSAANTVSGEYTTYAFAVDTAKSEASLITDGGQAVSYGTFAEAVTAAGNDSRANTVVLNKDLTYTANVTPPTSPDSLDLNGHTMTITNAYLGAGNKVVTIQDSSQAKTGKITGGKSGNGLVSLRYSGSLNLISGTIEDTSGTAAIITNGRSLSEISIGAAATVTSTGYGILIDTSATNNTSSNTIVHAYGTISATYGAIYVNGNVKDNGKDPLPVINVYEGARLSGTSGAGIYAAGQATWNISGGTTTGATGIYIKSGTLNVTGGSIVGNGEKAAPVYNGNGFNTTGDAIVADSCGYPGGVPSVNISGGALSSAKASAILSCMTKGTTPAKVTITGGYFTSDPSAYVASGYIAQTTAKAGYSFEVVGKRNPAVEVALAPAAVRAPESPTPEETAAVTALNGASTVTAGLESAAGQEAQKITTTAEQGKAALEAANKAVASGATVTIYEQPYLAIEVTDATTGSAPTLTVNIVPMVKTVASTADTAGSITTDNAVQIGGAQKLTVTTPVTIKLPITATMAGTPIVGNVYTPLQIKHIKEDGKVYYYKAEVTIEDGAYYATFTVTHGFSEFTLKAADTRPLIVTYDSDGGSAVTGSPITYSITDVGTALPTATKSGYTFTGWVFTGFSGTHATLPDLWDGAGNSNDVTATATAQYTAISTGGGGVSSYTLSFETNGGSKVNSVSKTYGTTVDLSAYVPTKEGCSFAGWYSDKALTTPVTSVKLTVNTTVYAKWTVKSAFTDVPVAAYYKDAVDWAVKNGITDGTSATTFSPDATCTRAQAVTFLWRAYGKPASASTVCPFTDVKADAYYYSAVLWAVEKGITEGTNATTFSPDANCTRAQIVTFQYRAAGSTATDTVNPFTDVAGDAYYASAVLWAVKEGITEGTTPSTFSPDAECTRAQIVTFLYSRSFNSYRNFAFIDGSSGRKSRLSTRCNAWSRLKGKRRNTLNRSNETKDWYGREEIT